MVGDPLPLSCNDALEYCKGGLPCPFPHHLPSSETVLWTMLVCIPCPLKQVPVLHKVTQAI